MDKVKAVLDGENEVLVDGLFYLYNSKYYLIYTEKEIDENGYVVLHLSQVGKEIKKSNNGTVDTGYMVGVEIEDIEDWKNVQKSITTIVEDKKSGKISPDIKYLPINMIKKIKILGSKRFRLVKDVLEQFFEVTFDSEQKLTQVIKPEISNETIVVENSGNKPIDLVSNVNNENNVLDSGNISSGINIFNPVKVESVNDESSTVKANEVVTPSIVESNGEAVESTINNIELNKTEENKVEDISEEKPDDNAPLMFKPNLDSSDTAITSDNNEGATNIESTTDDSNPVELFSEKNADESVDYKALYEELKSNNENLKQRVQDLELKLENIKNILG